MKYTNTVLGILELIVAIGAIPAGIMLILKPDGSYLGLPIELLNDTLFADYTIPGYFLLFINGLLFAVGSFFAFRKHRFSSKTSLALGGYLMLWILIQLYFINSIHWLHFFYFGIGFVMVILSWRTIRHKSKG